MKKMNRRAMSFLLALAMFVSLIPSSVFTIFAADEVTGGNSAGTTKNVAAFTNPFTPETEVELNGVPTKSQSYRIPSMVTLDDGTIVAAADIRWNTTYDGGGLDTLVATSKDGGATWSYKVANYLGDNGNVYNSQSTAFIDPSLLVAADGKTVYMLVDLYAYGVALNGNGQQKAPSTGTGFDSNGNLKLSYDNHYSYNYYLKNGKIYDSLNNVVEGYEVDAYFNITYTQNGEIVKSNLFFEDSPFKVARTGFLYMIKSTNDGESWSAPTLLNLKDSSEMVCLVGPGNGITTENGTMVFPVYSYNGNADSQKLGFVYSTDNGVTWQRSANFTGAKTFSSESAVVELESGNLRFFYRNDNKVLTYVDYDMTNNTWGAEKTTGVPTNSDTQLSAISYSCTADGKQVILVSCPTGPNGAGSDNNDGSMRTNGKIHVFIVNAAGEMTLKNTINVFDKMATSQLSGSTYTEENGFFSYSSLTERADGSIVMLYENNQFGWGAGESLGFTITGKAFAVESLGLAFDAPVNKVFDSEGNRVTSIVMGKYEKPEFSASHPFSSADVSYQWQLEYEEGKWVNIYGEDSKTIKLSYGMVTTLLNEDGFVNLRCETKCGSQTGYSKAIPVYVEMFEGDVAEVDLDNAQNSNRSLLFTAPYDVAPAAEGDGEGSTIIYTVVIEYKFKDGRQAANPFTATVEAGGDLKLPVKSPTVLGYTAQQVEFEINIEDIDRDHTYTVYYDPAEVDFTIVHQFQNVNDEGYTDFLRETSKGYTDSAVGENRGLTAEQMAQYGVYMLPYDVEQIIVADGSKELIIKYDRLYFLMTFDLSGGYNVEPIYARVDTPIQVGIPIRAGYVFEGWEPELPEKMPTQNTNIKAIWSPNPNGVTYFIAYWAENANDSDYSILKVETHDGVPGTTVSGGDTYGTLAGFHFDHADQNLTIKGDGSTVVNVYYKRNTYTLTFAYSGGPQICGGTHSSHNNCNRICGLENHTHSNSCCSKSGFHWTHTCDTNNCSYGYAHTHTDSCYDCDKVVHNQHDVDYGCYGVKFEGIKYGQDTSHWWSQAPSGYRWTNSVNGEGYTSAPDMPNGDLLVIGETLKNSYTYTIHYYEEGTTNPVRESISYYRSSNGYYLTSTDYIAIPGFTCLESGQTRPDNNLVYKIYYRRNSYSLTFMNGGEKKEAGSFLYEADISGQYYVPTHKGDDPDGVVFGGWYTTAECVEGTEWNPEGATMPSENMILYAKWAPVQHEVKLYITKADMEADKQYLQTMKVDHNALAQEPARPSNGDYKFVGWFYMEDGVEKGFTFDIPVRKSMQLYGKWYADELATYTIKYAVKNGDTLTYIADDTTGFAIAGYDKSFEAKYGPELYEDYRIGYYPETNSHSLTVELGKENTYTFIYVEKQSVRYTVNYLEKGTNAVLHTQKVDTTSEAIHTENFVYIKGYRPDAYQKRLVLSGNESENVITFWYETDTQHAPVLVKHYLQNPDGQSYNTDSPYLTTTDLDGVINQTYLVEILTTIEGFTFAYAEANHEVNGQKTPVTATVDDGKISAVVTNEGLLIELYYNRIEYPYEFQFILQGTDTQLREPITGTAIFGSQVKQAAISIPGYSCQTASQAITIQIEDGTTAVKNIRIFYYVEQTVKIDYVPVGGGSTSPSSQNNIPVLSGVVGGSTATPNAGYVFKGWYKDQACTIPVDSSWVNGYKITPQKSKVYGSVLGFESATYYAKFEEIKVTIYYEVDGPTGCGEVEPGSEKLGSATGEADGSFASASSAAFKFVGWYDSNGTLLSTDATYVPTKNADLWIDGTTYYAKFEYNLTSLTIVKGGAEEWKDIDPNQTFIFDIYDGNTLVTTVTVHAGTNWKVVIEGLTVGKTYTIKERTDWSWRYNCTGWSYTGGSSGTTNEATITISPDGTITFTNERGQDKWLDGDAWYDNLFKK